MGYVFDVTMMNLNLEYAKQQRESLRNFSERIEKRLL